MVTSIPPSLELCSVVAILCCKGNRYSCGASMVAFWEAPHSNPKELEFILSYRVGVRQSQHASTQRGRTNGGAWDFGDQGPNPVRHRAWLGRPSPCWGQHRRWFGRHCWNAWRFWWFGGRPSMIVYMDQVRFEKGVICALIEELHKSHSSLNMAWFHGSIDD